MSTARLRYGRFERDGVNHVLRQFEAAELPPDLFGGGPLGGTVREPGRLRQALVEVLERVDGPVDRATLVLPDSWLRVTFAEAGELPRGSKARGEVLRWKLRRLVPFRVEELRVTGRQVRPLAGQQEPNRLMLGFAIELLLEQLEDGFAEQGIHLGFISSESLSLPAAVEEPLRGVELGAFALVRSTGYSLVFSWQQEPLLHRYRALDMSDGGRASAELIQRDLRLTRAFLAEQLPAVERGRILLLCPPALQGAWLNWLERALELPIFLLGREHLALSGQPDDEPIDELAPLFGAARQVVA